MGIIRSLLESIPIGDQPKRLKKELRNYLASNIWCGAFSFCICILETPRRCHRFSFHHVWC
ncbi:hypothetical protein Q31b_44400 [Novipirellula aureliae]|uniref:Uncharacterized protein n=1 Tax=Novipirellula aureliae TaxID=2527966 RepID=A0A5C6DLZ6_9BACT|nr:hypothetical protein Q31b_44400 [Novipirellula aureliae]